mgnify:CR=1 FL=1
MHKYLITIFMHDGSAGRCKGLFATDWDAIDAVLAAFFDAKSIRCRRLS